MRGVCRYRRRWKEKKDEHRTSNVQHRILNEIGMGRFLILYIIHHEVHEDHEGNKGRLKEERIRWKAED
jgi:hypothetical protein